MMNQDPQPIDVTPQPVPAEPAPAPVESLEIPAAPESQPATAADVAKLQAELQEMRRRDGATGRRQRRPWSNGVGSAEHEPGPA